MIGVACRAAALMKLSNQMNSDIQALQFMIAKHPEVAPLVARLLTEDLYTLNDAFGGLVTSNSYGHLFDDFVADLGFILYFVGHEILDDGCPGIGYQVEGTFCSTEDKIETNLSHLIGITRYAVPQPFICRSKDFEPWIVPATIASIIGVLDHHSKGTTPSEEQLRRIQLAKDLGLVSKS